MLEVHEIYKTFNAGTINEKRAMNGVTLTLNEGDFATVIGGNGAGKSPCSIWWRASTRWTAAPSPSAGRM